MLLKVVHRQIRHFGYYLRANRHIAVYPDILARKNHVNLFEYHPERWYKEKLFKGNPYNCGDALSFVVVNWMLAQRSLSIDSNTARNRKYFLNTIGSNLLSSYQNATIWGSGCGAIGDIDTIWQRMPFRKLDIRAVRGPLTRKKVMSLGHTCPEVYGDPAILMPLIYQPRISGKQNRDLLVIPQFLYENDIREQYPDYPMESMNTSDYQRVIDSIVTSDKVITSSLHAIILAEVYGVPAVYFKSLPGDFKYHDYYASTGRTDIKLADSLEEALQMDPPPIPDFSKLQEGLLNSFPYDLWAAE